MSFLDMQDIDSDDVRRSSERARPLLVVIPKYSGAAPRFVLRWDIHVATRQCVLAVQLDTSMPALAARLARPNHPKI